MPRRKFIMLPALVIACILLYTEGAYAARTLPALWPFSYTPSKRDPFISPDAPGTEVAKFGRPTPKVKGYSGEDFFNQAVRHIRDLLTPGDDGNPPIRIGAVSVSGANGVALLNGQTVETGGAFKFPVSSAFAAQLRLLLEQAKGVGLKTERGEAPLIDDTILVFDVISITPYSVTLSIMGNVLPPIKYEIRGAAKPKAKLSPAKKDAVTTDAAPAPPIPKTPPGTTPSGMPRYTASRDIQADSIPAMVHPPAPFPLPSLETSNLPHQPSIQK